jgi:hypothetical protein
MLYKHTKTSGISERVPTQILFNCFNPKTGIFLKGNTDNSKTKYGNKSVSMLTEQTPTLIYFEARILFLLDHKTAFNIFGTCAK